MHASLLGLGTDEAYFTRSMGGFRSAMDHKSSGWIARKKVLGVGGGQYEDECILLVSGGMRVCVLSDSAYTL